MISTPLYSNIIALKSRHCHSNQTLKESCQC